MYLWLIENNDFLLAILTLLFAILIMYCLIFGAEMEHTFFIMR